MNVIQSRSSDTEIYIHTHTERAYQVNKPQFRCEYREEVRGNQARRMKKTLDLKNAILALAVRLARAFCRKEHDGNGDICIVL